MTTNNKKVLFIDYMGQRGHINFDRIHIDALKNQGFKVKIVQHKQLSSLFPYNKDEYALLLPTWLKEHNNSPLLNRIIFTLALLIIKAKVHTKTFDYVIMANYEEISLCLCPPAKEMYLISHGNAANFKNKIKKRLLCYLGRKHHFLVFNKRMTEPFLHEGLKVSIISHGCIPPYKHHKEARQNLDIDNYKYIIFHPSNKQSDDFLNNIIYNPILSDYLISNNALLVIRTDNNNRKNFGNIRFIHYFLPKDDYEELYTSSDVILMAYPSSFSYQVSGVGYECLACQKRMLYMNHQDLIFYRKYYNYDPSFNTAKELVNKLNMLFNSKEYKQIVFPSQLVPNYKDIFNKENRIAYE